MTKNTREHLVVTGMRRLLRHGYDGVGLGPMLAEAGVPKGSFYHFFKSKDDFTIAVIDAYALKYSALRERIFGDQTHTPLGRLFTYFQILEAEIVEEFPTGGCLYGVLSQTIGSRSKPLRSKLSKEFKAWERSIQAVLDDAKRIGELSRELDSRGTASLVIDLYEGALVRVKAENSLRALRQFGSHLRQLLRCN